MKKLTAFVSSLRAKCCIMKKNKQVILNEFDGNEGYWLRSAGSNDMAMYGANCHCGQLSFVTNIGAICAAGQSPASLGNGVRPAILINT